jgi:uroporphyrinogen-III decarboxylase
MLKTREDLPLVQLPDPCDEALYAGVESFLEHKEDYSTWLVTRFGIFPTMLSMGLQEFSIALYDDLSFVEELLDRYCDWAIEVARRVCGMGFDVFVTTDDIAYKTSPFFSPEVFRELMLPRYRRLADVLSLPWIFHSDGNMLPFLDDLVELGISGLHPIEDGAMDIRDVKRTYGDKICLLGNVNLNLLGLGTPENIDREVRGLIRDVGSGGGYIVTSGNSLAGYLKPENVVAMSKAVQKYGAYPLQ